ncbi:hypothetical protein RND71_003592 [Anisodus tanguticus]|uniref:Uncharacterized protein n=1 Tax=Anisodus tanguticus TaxID=243964 RepID=A0AAE1SWY7_9SOLA|nr:hypothetical protein RND71_003592 [Anisodus tanguticus]
MDYLFQNLGPPSANIPNEHGSKFDQVYYDDQAEPLVLESIKCLGKRFNKHTTSQKNQQPSQHWVFPSSEAYTHSH